MTKRILICDLDNTLYDWVGYFVPSFYAMVDAVVQITGCDREKLLDDFRKVHQKHHNSEHPFALLETATIQRLFNNSSFEEIVKKLDSAFHAFNSTRKRTLFLYPDVQETLDTLALHGVRLIAHTDSNLFAVIDRLQRLNITKYFSKIYCRERAITQHPNPTQGRDWLAQFPIDKIKELSSHEAKPSPLVLLEICANENAKVEEAVYIGDSMARDMLMAKLANVFCVWAAYGAHHGKDLYDSLVRISHWSRKEVEEEIELQKAAKRIQPDYIAKHSFNEILGVFNIDKNSPRRVMV